MKVKRTQTRINALREFTLFNSLLGKKKYFSSNFSRIASSITDTLSSLKAPNHDQSIGD